MLNYRIYLKDILLAIDKIEFSLREKNKEDFNKNIDLIDMTLMRIQVIGENISKLPYEIKNKYKLKWDKLERTRNIISHAYSNVNKEIIWDLITIELPKLKGVVNEILKKK